MCGIAFIIKYDKRKNMPLDIVEKIFFELNKRGGDSSGVYFERQEGTETIRRMYKSPIHTEPLWQYAQLNEEIDMVVDGAHNPLYTMNGKENLIMLHARKKTQGTEQDNNNNMPIFSHNFVLIHNGVLSGARPKNYDYMGEVDSEEILANVEHHGIIKGLESTQGSMSIALKPFENDYMYVFRNSMPLYVMFLKQYNVLIGCSDDDYVPLDEMEIEFTSQAFEPKVTVQRMPSNKLYKISLKQKEIEFISDIQEKRYNTNCSRYGSYRQQNLLTQ
jgi:asparagine synthetase B (glutamine-hydrolysing)